MDFDALAVQLWCERAMARLKLKVRSQAGRVKQPTRNRRFFGFENNVFSCK